jgi:hypothetical protein
VFGWLVGWLQVVTTVGLLGLHHPQASSKQQATSNASSGETNKSL